MGTFILYIIVGYIFSLVLSSIGWNEAVELDSPEKVVALILNVLLWPLMMPVFLVLLAIALWKKFNA